MMRIQGRRKCVSSKPALTWSPLLCIPIDRSALNDRSPRPLDIKEPPGQELHLHLRWQACLELRQVAPRHLLRESGSRIFGKRPGELANGHADPGLRLRGAVLEP